MHQNDQASDQANSFIFNTLDDVIAFCDQASDQASDQAKAIVNIEVHNKVGELLLHLDTWMKSENLFDKIALSNHSTNRKKYLEPLLKLGWIDNEFPNTPTHPNQRYIRSQSGTKLLKLIS